MIDETVIADIEARMRGNKPVFGDLTVGDITEENMPLLEKALDGDEKAIYRLLYLTERSHSYLGEVIIRGPFER